MEMEICCDCSEASTACECPQRLLISIGDFFPDAAFSPKTPGSAEYEP